MAKITDKALRKRGWRHKRQKGINPKYWYYRGKSLFRCGKDNYRLDKYSNCDIYIFDVPYPNDDIGGWAALREINTLEQLDNLIKALEIQI